MQLHHQRPCTPPMHAGAMQSPEAFTCYQQMDFSPLPWSKGLRVSEEASGLTSPRGPSSPCTSTAEKSNPFGSNFPLHCGGGVGGQMPLSSMQTPVRSEVEVDYCSRLHDVLKHSNDMHRGASAPPVTQLHEYMYVGGAPSEETAAELTKLGITHVVNLIAHQCPPRDYVTRRFHVTPFQTDDTRDYFIIYYAYETFKNVVNEVRQRGGKVFVHCFAGVNRSVSLCAAYLLEQYDWELMDVVRHIHSRGRMYILDNPSFQQQLVEFYIREVVPNRHPADCFQVRLASNESEGVRE